VRGRFTEGGCWYVNMNGGGKGGPEPDEGVRLSELAGGGEGGDNLQLLIITSRAGDIAQKISGLAEGSGFLKGG